MFGCSNPTLDVPGGRGRRHLVRHRGRRRKSADPGRAAVAVRAQRHGDAAQDSSIIFNVDDDIRDYYFMTMIYNYPLVN